MSEKKKGFFAAENWQVELQGGWSAINPRCLNMFPRYYEQEVSFLVLDSYKYTQQIFGNKYNYSLSLDPKNAFRELKNAFPLDISIRYRVSRRFDVSLGLGYSGGQAESFFQASIDTKTVPPNSYGTWGLDDIVLRDLTYDDMSISVRSWIPTAGLHFNSLSRRVLRAELFATAGPVFASFKHRYHEFDKYTFPDGFWFAWEYRGRYEGQGVGIALSCGGRLGVKLASRLEMFLAAGYGLVSVPRLQGSEETSHRFLDVESEPPEFTRRESVGTWYVYATYYQRAWGQQLFDVPLTMDYASQYLKEFTLDLSGFRLQAGIAIKL